MTIEVNERNSCRYTGQLKDQTGTALPLAALTTVTLTLYDVATGSIIGGLDHASILNAGRGTVSAGGLLTIDFEPADNQLVGTPAAGLSERHIAEIEWTWNSGAGRGSKDVLIVVKQLAKTS